MSTLKKATILGILLVILVLAGFGFSHNTDGAIKVGVILPLSGQYSALGESAQNAILLSQKDVESKKESKIDFVFEDDRYETKTALSAYRKLRDFDKVQAIISLSAPTIAAIAPLVTEEKVLTLQLGTELAHTKDPIFQLMPAGEVVYTRLGEEAAKRYRKIAVVYENAELFALNTQFFQAGLLPETERVDFKIAPDADYRTEIQKILRTNPDTLALFLSVEGQIKFLKEFKNQTGKNKIPLVCDANTQIAIEQLKKAVGADVFEGCISTAFPNTMTASFVDEYKKAYASDPQFTADYAYDAVRILDTLSETASVKNWVSVLENGFEYSGASGDISFDDVGTRFGAAEVFVFKNGNFVPIKE